MAVGRVVEVTLTDATGMSKSNPVENWRSRFSELRKPELCDCDAIFKFL